MPQNTKSAVAANSGKLKTMPAKTTNVFDLVVQKLLAQGLTMEDIVLPGGAKDIITYVADDFNKPLSDFADYM